MTLPVHDEEVLGKAYDRRLMGRLLTYLHPYWRQALTALGAIVVGALTQLAQPYLIKVAIDQHIAAGSPEGLDRLAAGDVIFPLRMGRLEIFGVDPPEGTDIACRIAIRAVDRYRVTVDA